MQLLHESYFGIQRTKQKAHEIVDWPGLMTKIENVIAKCTICERFRNLNSKESVTPHDIPDIPFNKVGCDILYFEGLFGFKRLSFKMVGIDTAKSQNCGSCHKCAQNDICYSWHSETGDRG